MAEDELHAYVDGLLPAERKGSVESYLSSAPCERERVQAYRQQNIELHRLFDRPAYEPIPPRYESLIVGLSRARRRQRIARWVVSGAAVASIATLAAMAGWSGLERYRVVQEYPLLAFTQQATRAHLMAVGRGGVDDVDGGSAAGAAALGGLPSDRLIGMPLPSPDLADDGFILAGGRILPTGHGPAVQLVYANKSGRRVTLFIGPATTGHRGTFTILEESDVSLVYWQMGKLGYSLVGNVDRKTLVGLAESVIGSLAPSEKSARSPEAVPPAGEKSLSVAVPVVGGAVDSGRADGGGKAIPPEGGASALATGVVREPPPARPRKRDPHVSDIKLEPRT